MADKPDRRSTSALETGAHQHIPAGKILQYYHGINTMVLWGGIFYHGTYGKYTMVFWGGIFEVSVESFRCLHVGSQEGPCFCTIEQDRHYQCLVQDLAYFGVDIETAALVISK